MESWLAPESAETQFPIPAGLSPCPGGLGTQLTLCAQALPCTALTHQPSKPLSWACSTPHWGGRTKPLVLGLFFYFQMDLFSGSIQGLPSLRGGRGPSARLILGGSRKKKKGNLRQLLTEFWAVPPGQARRNIPGAFKGAWQPGGPRGKKDTLQKKKTATIVQGSSSVSHFGLGASIESPGDPWS